MTDTDRIQAQARVDEVCEHLGAPNYGAGFKCRVRHDNDGHGFWIRINPAFKPDVFRDQLAQALKRHGWDVDVWLNKSQRYCRIDWKNEGGTAAPAEIYTVVDCFRVGDEDPDLYIVHFTNANAARRYLDAYLKELGIEDDVFDKLLGSDIGYSYGRGSDSGIVYVRKLPLNARFTPDTLPG